MSNLIKKEEHLRYHIESFEEKELGGITKAPERREVNGRVLLPNGDLHLSGKAEKALRGDLNSLPNSPKEQLAQLEREAYEKGFEQGQKDGLTLGEKRVEQTLRQTEALLSELSQLKKRIYLEAEQELIKLSVEIAKKIVNEEIRTDSAFVTRSIRRALDFLVDKSRIRVLISPEDMNEVQKVVPQMAEMHKTEQFQIVEDKSIKRGGCVLESGFGRINATIEDQLSVLSKELDEEQTSQSGAEGASLF